MSSYQSVREPSLQPNMNFILVGFLLLAVTYYFYHYGRIKTLKNRLWHDMKDIETFLRNRKTKYKVKLVEKIAVTHDTFRYRFSLGDRTLRLGLPVGKCLKVFGANIAHAQKAKEWNPRPETERNGNVVPYQLYESYEFQPRGGAVIAMVVVAAKDKSSNTCII